MTERPVRPPRLRPGDTVAVLSPSWGGPAAYPGIYEVGLRALRQRLDLRVREMPTARMAAEELYRRPDQRARDVEAAFRDPDVKAVVASVGGEDSVRVLPHLEPGLFRRHPKVLLGYSDVTTLLVAAHLEGLVTFHGPVVMAGIAQLGALPEQAEAQLRAVLFEGAEELELRPYPWWSGGYPDWGSEAHLGEVLERRPHDGWRWLQGDGPATGRLWGGCIEVLEFLKGTRFWPPPEFWEGRLLFFETSEEAPPPAQVKRMLRNYGVQGAFGVAAGVLFGRPRGYDEARKEALQRILVEVVAGEFGRPDLPVVANMDFGHTDPQWVLPLGVEARLDPGEGTFTLREAAVE